MENKKLEKSEEQKVEQPVAAEPQKPQLASGLFKPFTLGSTLKQGPIGNVMDNMKKPMMDYEAGYKASTKNESFTPDQMKGEVKKAHIGFEKLKEKLAHKKGVSNPAAVAAAIGRKKYGKEGMEHLAEEGKKSEKKD